MKNFLMLGLVILLALSAPTGSQDVQSIGEVGDLLVQYGLVRVVVAGDTLYLYADKVLADSARFGSLKVTGVTDLVGTVRLRSNVIDDTVKIAVGLRNEGPTVLKKQVSIYGYGIGATLDTTKSVKLINTTAAAAGAQQYSPAIILESQGWKTDATAGPQYTQWAMYNQPVQGSSAPTSRLNFDYRIGSSAWANGMYITSTGAITGGHNITATRSLLSGAAYGVYVGNLGVIGNSVGGGLKIGPDTGTEMFMESTTHRIGLGTLTPLNHLSLVDATSGQGTGLHVVSSQWNKARSTWAAAHDTSSIVQYIDSAGGPRWSMKAVDGDSLGITLDGTSALFRTSAGSMYFYIGATNTFYCEGGHNRSIELRPFSSDTYNLGISTRKWADYWGSDNIYLGGKSQTATMTISGENTIAGTDSSLVLSAASGVPTISAMHTGTFTNGGRRFYTGADTLLLVNGAKTGRDSTVYVLPNGYVGINAVPTTPLYVSGSSTLSGSTTVSGGFLSVSRNSSAYAFQVNQQGTGLIADFQDNGVSVLKVPDGGQVEINGNKSADTLLIVRNDRIGSPYDSVFTVLSNGNMGSNGVVTIKRSVSLTDAGEYTPQIPAGMCGWGTVMAGEDVEWARFRFKADGTVALEANSTNVGTTNDVDAKMNIYDAGSSGIIIENQLGSTLKFAVVIECFTP